MEENINTIAPSNDVSPSSSITPVGQINNTHKRNNFILAIFIVVVILLVGVIVYMFNENAKLKDAALKPQPESPIVETRGEPTESTATVEEEMPVVTEEDPSVDNRNLYTNTDFRFSFRLLEDEHAVTCDNKNQYNDNVSVWISSMSGVVGNAECASGGSITDIFASRKANEFNSVDGYLSALSRDYIFDQTEVEVSGITAVRVIGEKSSEPSPLPKEIDKVVFSSDGILYVVDAFYLNRDFQVIE